MADVERIDLNTCQAGIGAGLARTSNNNYIANINPKLS